ncbi:MAG: isoamylase early set domain-containing protein [Caldilineaceae bacterium]|nr:isoamylase early set domain-containing protein [Caldilineaceae bacterium]
MIYKTPSPKPDHVRVVFELPASLWADQVFLVGDFNRWDPTTLPLTQDRQGVWRAILDLPVGTSYQFCYLIDGQRHTDFHADGWSAYVRDFPKSVIAVSLASILPAPTDDGL